MGRIEPVLDLLQQLDDADAEAGAGAGALAAEIAREEAELRRFEEAFAGRVADAADYGRIVVDLPDAASTDSPAKLDRVEALLLFAEGTLARLAASARAERGMLEGLG